LISSIVITQRSQALISTRQANIFPYLFIFFLFLFFFTFKCSLILLWNFALPNTCTCKHGHATVLSVSIQESFIGVKVLTQMSLSSS
jgi:hypothetical protein